MVEGESYGLLFYFFFVKSIVGYVMNVNKCVIIVLCNLCQCINTFFTVICVHITITKFKQLKISYKRT